MVAGGRIIFVGKLFDWSWKWWFRKDIFSSNVFLQVPCWFSAVYRWMFPSNQTMMKPSLIQACGHMSLHFWWVRLLCSVIVSFHGALKVDLYFECSSRSKAHDSWMPSLHNFFLLSQNLWGCSYDLHVCIAFLILIWTAGCFLQHFWVSTGDHRASNAGKVLNRIVGSAWMIVLPMACMPYKNMTGFVVSKYFLFFTHTWGKGSKSTSIFFQLGWQKTIRFSNYVNMYIPEI